MTAQKKAINAARNVPRYSRAPIIEAALRIATKEMSSPAPLSSLHSFIAAEFPVIHQKFELIPSEDESESSAEGTSKRFVGYDYVSAERRYILKVRVDGLQLSRVGPYETWDVFAAEAERFWRIYEDAVQPTIVGLATRFINRLEIPMPVDDLRKYLRILPDMGNLPHLLNSFFMRVKLPIDDMADVTIIEGTVPTEKDNIGALMLDIEVSRGHGIQREMLWSLFSEMRSIKNRVFEDCITDDYRALIR